MSYRTHRPLTQQRRASRQTGKLHLSQRVQYLPGPCLRVVSGTLLGIIIGLFWLCHGLSPEGKHCRPFFMLSKASHKSAAVAMHSTLLRTNERRILCPTDLAPLFCVRWVVIP